MKFWEEKGYESLLDWCEATKLDEISENFEGRTIRYIKVPSPSPCPTISATSFREDGLREDLDIRPQSLWKIFITRGGVEDFLCPEVWMFSLGGARNLIRKFYEEHGHLGKQGDRVY